jgi:1,4-dihydroxy-2-naphthoate octaprenyltransferase
MNAIDLINRLIRPLFILNAMLLYALGAGIAHYLGVQIDVGLYLLGQGWITLVQLSAIFLHDYFYLPAYQAKNNQTTISGKGNQSEQRRIPPRANLFIALACLSGVASLSVLLIAIGDITPVAGLIMVIGFLGAFFYSIPPVSLNNSGYGELTIAVLVAFLTPAFAFTLQYGDLHRLITMSTSSLVIFYLAMLLALELPSYATDLRLGKNTLIFRLGCDNGLKLHNLLILSAYLVLAIAAAFGMPLFAALPVFLTFPLGLLQIWQVWRIDQGARPNWLALMLNAIVLFGASAYLMAFAFFTH